MGGGVGGWGGGVVVRVESHWVKQCGVVRSTFHRYSRCIHRILFGVNYEYNSWSIIYVKYVSA